MADSHSFASDEQRLVASAVGTVSGCTVNKLADIPGLEVEPGNRIDAPMFLGGVMSVECKVRETVKLDSSTLFVGEVVFAKVWDRMPLGYHKGETFKYGEKIPDGSTETE